MTTLPRPYCTQPRPDGEGCETCSLVNYGRDCHNEPIGSDDHADIRAADESEVAERLARRWLVCVHEAGHAVAGWVLGLKPALMLLTPNGGGLTMHDSPRAGPFEDAVRSIAGPFALELGLPRPSNPPDGPPGAPLPEDDANTETRDNIARLRERAESDMDSPIRWGREVPERGEARARLVFATVRALLVGHRDDVEKLALALWEHSALDAPMIEPLLPRRLAAEETSDAG